MKRAATIFLIVIFLLQVGCSAQQTGNGDVEGEGGAEGAGDTQSEDSEVIEIGSLLALSGPAALFGNQNQTAFEIARDMINEQGGINGKEVVFVTADAPDPSAAASETERLITREGIQVMLHGGPSSHGLPASDMAARYDVSFWEALGGSMELTERGHRYFFKTMENSDVRSQIMVDYAVDVVAPTLNIPAEELRLAIIFEDSNFGSDFGKWQEIFAEERGINVVAHEAYDASAQDMTSLILRLKEANPDVLLATSYLDDAILFWRQAKELDFNVKAMIGGGAGHNQPQFINAVGEDGEGVFTADASSSTGISTEGLSPEAQALREEYLRRFEEKTGETPTIVADMGFLVSYTLLHRVLPHAESLDPDDIREAALAVDLPMGSTVVGYGIKFAENGQNQRVSGTILQWQDGKLTSVYPENLAVADPILLPLPAWEER